MRYQELNLLVIFDAIMTEASITRAGERLNMTQPAVSNAVGRMRHIWKDELFIKDGRKILPTIYAEQLWEGTRTQLADIRNALEPAQFEPAYSDRIFRVAAIDSIVGLFWPDLRELIEAQAPNISIHTYPYEFSNATRILTDAKVEILVTASNLMPQSTTSQFLCDLEYVTVMKSDHQLTKKKITIEEYARADHLLVAPSGNTQGVIDKALYEIGLTRKIGVSVNGFSGVSSILTRSNLICTLPSIYIEDSLSAGHLVAQEPPIQVPNTRINAYWHQRSENDEGVFWLRERITQIVKKRVSQHRKIMMNLLNY